MNDFKVKDIVICVDNECAKKLIKHKSYEIENIPYSFIPTSIKYKNLVFININGSVEGFNYKRFTTLQKYRKYKLNNLNNLNKNV